MPRSQRFWPAIVLLFGWSAPAFAQGDGSAPIIEYGVGLAATVVVLLVVCWPAKRK
jgi:hypothetical protein